MLKSHYIVFMLLLCLHYIIKRTTSQQVLDELIMATETSIIPGEQSVHILSWRCNDRVLSRELYYLLILYLQRAAVPVISHIEVHISLFNKVSERENK